MFEEREAVLVQIEPRGLWYISPLTTEPDIEKLWDEKYGGMPLRVALMRLRMGV